MGGDALELGDHRIILTLSGDTLKTEYEAKLEEDEIDIEVLLEMLYTAYSQLEAVANGEVEHSKVH